MTRSVRALLLLAIALLAVRAWRASGHEGDVRRGARAYEAGDYRSALEHFEKALARSSSDSLVWTWLGDTAGALHQNAPAGGWEKGREEELLSRMAAGYTGAVLRCPSDSWSWSGIADAALRRARREDLDRGVRLSDFEMRSRRVLDPWRAVALGAASVAVELKPAGYLELDVLAEVLGAAGQADAAREALLRSARMLPAPAMHAWGSPRAKLGRSLYTAILEGLREGLRNAPTFDHSKFHLAIGRFALAQGDVEEAIAEMLEAERTASTVHDVYHAIRYRAEALEAGGRLEESVAAWDAAIALDFGPDSDRRQRGLLLSRLGRKAEACADLRDALRGAPEDSALRSSAAVACEEAGEPEIAARLLQEGFVSPEDDPALARGLLELHVRSGKRETAAALASRWARESPQRADLAAWAREFAGAGR